MIWNIGENVLFTIIYFIVIATCEAQEVVSNAEVEEFKKAELLLPQIIDKHGLHSYEAAKIFNEMALHAEKAGLDDLTEKYYQKSINSLEKRELTSEKAYTTVLCNFAKFYINQMYFDKAHAILNKARKKVDGTDDSQLLKIQLTYAKLYLEEKDYINADQVLKIALELSKKESGDVNKQALEIESQLAELYTMQSRYNDAEKLYSKMLQKIPEMYNVSSPEVIPFLIHMGNFEETRKAYDAAIDFYMMALDSSLKNYGGSHLMTADIYENIASVLDKQMKIDEAIVFYDLDLNIRREKLGNTHVDLLSGLNDKALCLQISKRFSEAEHTYKEAQKVIKSNRITDLSVLCTGNFAMLYFDQEKYEQCEKYLKTALKYCGNSLDKTTTQHISLLRKFIMLYKATNQTDKLLPYYQRSYVLIHEAMSNGVKKYDEFLEEVLKYFNSAGKELPTLPNIVSECPTDRKMKTK